MLKEVITEYLLWMIEKGYEERTFRRIERVLEKFLFFAERKRISWERMFTSETKRAEHYLKFTRNTFCMMQGLIKAAGLS
jgi:hypothetical protein